MPKSFKEQVTFWLPIVIVTLLIGYATNALMSAALMLMDRLVELPQWIVWYGGLASFVPPIAASSVWLAKIPAAPTRYSRGLKLAGLLFLLVIPPTLTLLIVDGASTNSSADGVAGAILMASFVTVWYGLPGGCLLIACRIASRSNRKVWNADFS